MAISILHSSSNSNSFSQTQKASQNNSAILSSGKRINKAADDPAGLQISNRLTSQLNALEKQSQGAHDSINLNNIQSAKLSSITDNLARAQQLSVQSGNPLYQNSSAIQDELTALTEEINVVASDALEQDNFITNLNSSDPATTQANIEQALKSVDQQAAQLGADSNTLSSQINTYETSRVNLAESRSRIQDTDFAAASTERAKIETLENIAIKLQKSQLERKGLLINTII